MPGGNADSGDDTTDVQDRTTELESPALVSERSLRCGLWSSWDAALVLVLVCISTSVSAVFIHAK